MTSAPYTLILLRHGESEWNAKNLFTGWVDVDLNDKGRAEARRGGELLKEAGLLPDVVHTSLLKRAINTSQLHTRYDRGRAAKSERVQGDMRYSAWFRVWSTQACR